MPVNSSNFSSNSLTGSVRVSGGQAVINLGINKFALQGTQNFVVNLRKDSVSGPIIATSSNVTIQDTSSFVGLTANVSTVAEGDLVRFTLTTANAVNGSAVWYSIFPVTANVTSDDFTSNVGSFAIYSNQGVFDLQASRNMSVVDEAGEVFKLQIRSASPTGNIVYTSSNITISDTYKIFVANIFFEASNLIYEGTNVTFTLNFQNTPIGSTIYYDTIGNVTSSTFVTGNTGSFVYNGSNITLGLPVADILTGQTLDFRLRLKQDSISGNVFATSNLLNAADIGAAYNSGTGGTYVFASNGYKVHVFTSSDTFTFTQGNNPSFNKVDYYIVGGGGAGGVRYGGGGGGGGALAFVANTLQSNTYTIVIGAGGGGAGDDFIMYPASRSSGGNTTAFGLVAYGGGGGGSGANVFPPVGGISLNGAFGGSGGGGGGRTSNPAPYGAAGANVVGQGYPGGTAGPNSFDVAAGGGGAGGAGGPTAVYGPGPAPGGPGFQISWLTYTGAGSPFGAPSPVGRSFAGGGAGYYGPGGQGSSFAPSNPTTPKAPSAAGSGGGAGGGVSAVPGANSALLGGSGIVIVRYQYPLSTVIDIIVSNTFNKVFATNSNIDLIVRTFNATGNVLYLSTVGNVAYDDIFGGNVKQFTVSANDYTIVNFPIKANTIPTGETRTFNFVVKNSANSIMATSSNTYTIAAGAFIDATGGTITLIDGYKYHVFTNTSNANLVINSTGSVANNNIIDWMAVAGGGASGELAFPTPSTYGGGGGGAGGLIWGNATITSGGTYIVRAGAGGTSRGANGFPSLFMFGSPLFKEAYGGGGGGNFSLHPMWNNPGGSGGGAAPSSGGYTSPAGVAFGSPGPGVANPANQLVPNAAGLQGWPGGQYSGPGSSPPLSFDPPSTGGGGGGGAGSYGGKQFTNPIGHPQFNTQGNGGWGKAVPWLTLPVYGTPGPVAGVRYFAAGGFSQNNGQASPTGGAPGQIFNFGGSANVGSSQGFTVTNSGSGGSFVNAPYMSTSFGHGAAGIVIIRYPYN